MVFSIGGTSYPSVVVIDIEDNLHTNLQYENNTYNYHEMHAIINYRDIFGNLKIKRYNVCERPYQHNNQWLMVSMRGYNIACATNFV